MTYEQKVGDEYGHVHCIPDGFNTHDYQICKKCERVKYL